MIKICCEKYNYFEFIFSMVIKNDFVEQNFQKGFQTVVS